MRPHPDRQAVKAMAQAGCSIRHISRIMNMSRNTVRRILHGEDPSAQSRTSKYEPLGPLLEQLFVRCKGNAVLIQQLLASEHGWQVPYTTLTRLIRERELRGPKKTPSGTYHYVPGAEAQHDTSPHRLIIDEKPITAQCASFALAFSRMLFFQYYPCFTRFEAKCFLADALDYLDAVAPVVIIDNTSVIVAHGSGPDATIAPEMEAFGRIYSMRFVPHAIGHADRKAIVERNFHYIENSFLPGRTFKSWQDLNEQARNWCDTIANLKPKRSLSMSPCQAFVNEKPHLQTMPPVRAPIYVSLQRTVDLSGFVTVDTNRYSVPQKYCGRSVEVHKTYDTIRVYDHHRLVCEHTRLIGRRDARSTIPGHHNIAQHHNASTTRREETVLRAHSDTLSAYVTALKKHVRGSGIRQIQQLLALKRTYPAEAFDKAVARAQTYKLYNLTRLEKLILSFVAGDFFNLTGAENDDEKQ